MWLKSSKLVNILQCWYFQEVLHQIKWNVFSSDPGVPGVRSIGPDVCPLVTTRLCADLIDVSLADKDCKSTPTDDITKPILGNVAIQVRHLVAKIVTDSRSANCWPNLQLMLREAIL